MTATDGVAAGFLSVVPQATSATPATSSVNMDGPGETRAVAAITPIGAGTSGRRSVAVYTQSDVQLVVDVLGSFTGPTAAASTGGLFLPAQPTRVLDARNPGAGGRLWPGWTVEGTAVGAPFPVAAAAMNVTATESYAAGFFTASAARRPRPGTSTLNTFGGGQTVANHAVVPLASGNRFQIYSSGGSHVIADHVGSYRGPALPPVTGTPVNPPPPPIGPTWRLGVPALELDVAARSGPISVADAGDAWHWTGTGWMGESAQVVLFGHRTSHVTRRHLP